MVITQHSQSLTRKDSGFQEETTLNNFPGEYQRDSPVFVYLAGQVNIHPQPGLVELGAQIHLSLIQVLFLLLLLIILLLVLHKR